MKETRIAALPQAFQKNMLEMLGGDARLLFEALNSESPVTIRYNPFKRKPGVIENPGQPVPWNSNAFYLEDRPSFTLDPAFHTGKYYVQEAGSMFVMNALHHHIDGDPNRLRILDLCAAPGGKSTLLTELGGEHLYVSNEVIRSRYNTLHHNLSKWGLANRVVLQHDVKRMKALGPYFDIVLVDAPCSGEGMFRKDHVARSEWSDNNVQHCQARQRRILAGAAELVRPGGLLVYCTCTFNRIENEENMTWLAKELDFRSLEVPLSASWNITEERVGGIFSYRFYPHLCRSEGFCLSIMQSKHLPKGKNSKSKNTVSKRLSPVSRKQLSQIPLKEGVSNGKLFFEDPEGSIRMIDEAYADDVQSLGGTLGKSVAGLCLGSFKQSQFIPDHALALNAERIDCLPDLELELADAIRFLRKDPMDHKGTSKSWHCVSYKGMGLGWAKVLDRRTNNYLPKNVRILMQVDYDSLEDPKL